MPTAQPDGAIEMQDQANERMDEIADRAKRKAGEMLEMSRIEREHRATSKALQHTAEAPPLVPEPSRQAAAQHGQQMVQQDR